MEERIFIKAVRGVDKPFVECLVRKKDIQLKPEEAVRQLYLMVLHDEYGYPYERMEIEHAVSFGREKKRADIVIFDKQDTRAIFIMVELKKPKLKDGKEQLKSYCNATGAPIGVWSNGDSISYYHRKDPNYFEDLSAIPKANQKLSDILTERWTIEDLVKKDKLVTEKKSLKDLILEMEDEVLANAGVDVFEELFKLIFTKLYDEMESGRNKSRHLEFRNYGDTETELKEKIQSVFSEVVEFNQVEQINQGDLCYMPSPTASINIFIAQKGYTKQKKYTKLTILDKRIQGNYLLWFLDLPVIKEYLMCYATGAIYSTIPKAVFDKLEIPLPKGQVIESLTVITLDGKKTPFRILLDQYYQQYLHNLEVGHLMTAAILAGAIAETFIHNYLLEVGMSEKLLDSKALGALIGLAEAYLIGRNIDDFPINHFKEIQKLRNSAVHPALAKGKIEKDDELELREFDCFNHLIRYFGL